MASLRTAFMERVSPSPEEEEEEEKEVTVDTDVWVEAEHVVQTESVGDGGPAIEGSRIFGFGYALDWTEVSSV